MTEPLRALSPHLEIAPISSLSLSKLLTERKDITKQTILVHSELSCYTPVNLLLGLSFLSYKLSFVEIIPMQ